MDVTLDIGGVIAAFAAIAGGWLGIKQYRTAENWKRAKFSVEQVTRAWNDETLAFCCNAIDWGVGPLIVPSKYKPLFPGGVSTVNHDWHLMAKALRPQLEADWSQNGTQAQFLLYRRAFDEFFAYLDALALYAEYGLVRDQELTPLSGYIRQLPNPPYWTSDQSERLRGISAPHVFMDFAREFYSSRLLNWIREAK